MSAVRYTSKIRARAVTLSAAGWMPAEIRTLLHREFDVRPGLETIRKWTNPAAYERVLVLDRERRNELTRSRSSFSWPGRPPTPEWIEARARSLRSRGVPASSIAKVLSHDHGQAFSLDAVRGMVRS